MGIKGDAPPTACLKMTQQKERCGESWDEMKTTEMNLKEGGDGEVQLPLQLVFPSPLIARMPCYCCFRCSSYPLLPRVYWVFLALHVKDLSWAGILVRCKDCWMCQEISLILSYDCNIVRFFFLNQGIPIKFVMKHGNDFSDLVRLRVPGGDASLFSTI